MFKQLTHHIPFWLLMAAIIVCSAIINNVSAANSNNISRAMFTSDIKNREPVDNLTAVPGNLSTIYYFTELVNLKGRSVTHQWKINNQPAGRMRFRVGANRWRVNTKKTITRGTLSVDIILDDGTILQNASISTNGKTQTTNEPAPAIVAPTPSTPDSNNQENTPVEKDTLETLLDGDQNTRNAINELLGITESTAIENAPVPAVAPQTPAIPVATQQPEKAQVFPSNRAAQPSAQKQKNANRSQVVAPTPTAAPVKTKQPQAVKKPRKTNTLTPVTIAPGEIIPDPSKPAQVVAPTAKTPVLTQDKKSPEQIVIDAIKREMDKVSADKMGVATQPTTSKPKPAATQKPAKKSTLKAIE